MGRMILTFGNKTRFGTRLFMNLRKGTLIMRSWLLAIWLMLPAVVGAYHFGPGQNGMKMDKAMLTQSFDHCLLTDDEMLMGAMGLDMNAWKVLEDPFPAWNQHAEAIHE